MFLFFAIVGLCYTNITVCGKRNLLFRVPHIAVGRARNYIQKQPTGKTFYHTSIVKATRCINFSNLFYFGTTFYIFRKVFPYIIGSSRLYIQQQVYVIQILLPACQQAGNSICLTYTCCCMYSLELLMMYGKTFRNM